MCYNVAANLRSQIKYAKGLGVEKPEIDYLNKQLEKIEPRPYWNADGFSRPKLLVVTNEKPKDFQLYKWKLIPSWAKDISQFKANTLNARDDTMWDIPSYRHSSIHNRCLVFVDGFFEPHHYGKKDAKGKDKVAYYYIESKNDEPLVFAGLWNRWISKDGTIIDEGFSIITTNASPLLTKIHNMAKRMPAILPRELQMDWLEPVTFDDGKTVDPVKKEKIMELIRPYDDEQLIYKTVRNIKKKGAPGNEPEAIEEYDYIEDDEFKAI